MTVKAIVIVVIYCSTSTSVHYGSRQEFCSMLLLQPCSFSGSLCRSKSNFCVYLLRPAADCDKICRALLSCSHYLIEPLITNCVYQNSWEPKYLFTWSKNFPYFFGILKFVTACTRHGLLPVLNYSNLSHVSPCFLKIFFNIIVPFTPMPYVCSFFLRFPRQNHVHVVSYGYFSEKIRRILRLSLDRL